MLVRVSFIWVILFSIINTVQAQDVWLQNYFAPNTGCLLSNMENVNVLVYNNSSVVMPSNTITVYYSVNGGAPVSQFLNSNLFPGASWNFTFSVKADLSACGTYALKVWVRRQGDVNQLNDTIAWNVTNICFDTPGSISGPTTVCQGQNSVTYTIPSIQNATAYSWTLPNGANGSSTTNSITVDYSTTATSGNITVAGTNTCGSSAVATLPVTVNPLPEAAGTISGPTTVCQAQNAVTYTIPAINLASSYQWTLPGGATGTSATNQITLDYAANAVSGALTVVGTNACGNGAAASATVTVNPLPAAADTIDGTWVVCQQQNAVTYSIALVADASGYLWTLPNGATGTSTTNEIILDYGTNAVSGLLTVTPTNACGNGAAASAAVTVNPLPAAADTIDGTWVVCQQQNAVSYSIALVADASGYLWTLPNGATGTSTTNEIILDYGTNAVSGLLTVTPTNACGNGAAASAAVTVNPLPAAADTIDGTWVVCQQQNEVTYSVPLIANASGYVWTLPDGATGTSTTNSISVDFSDQATTGAITVTGTNGCGLGNSAVDTIVVVSLPIAFAGNDTTICEGALVSLTATGGNNYVWNNGAVQEVPFLPDTTQTYTVSVSNGTCQSTDSVTVTVSATPVTPTISATGQIFSSSAGYGNQWYNDLGIIAGANNQQYTPVSTGNYFVIVTDSVGCISDTSNSLYFTEVGITDLIRADLITAYPNPAEHDVTIRVNGNQETTYKLSMINTLGQILYTGQITYANKTIDLSGYAPGIYTLVFELNDTYYSRKLILK